MGHMALSHGSQHGPCGAIAIQPWRYSKAYEGGHGRMASYGGEMRLYAGLFFPAPLIGDWRIKKAYYN